MVPAFTRLEKKGQFSLSFHSAAVRTRPRAGSGSTAGTVSPGMGSSMAMGSPLSIRPSPSSGSPPPSGTPTPEVPELRPSSLA